MIRQITWTPIGGAPQPAEVEIGEPVRDGDGWACALEIRGMPYPFNLSFPGRDALEALLIATWCADTIVRAHAHGGRLTWDGGDHLGFVPPPAWRLSWWRRIRAWWTGRRWARSAR